MIRLPRWFGLTLATLFLLALLVAGARWLEAAATPTRAPAIWGDPHVDFVLDTSAGMNQELSTLAAVWDDADIVHLQNPTFGRYWFTDTVNALPPTGKLSDLQSWLDNLQAGDGGPCPDAALQALLAAARRADPGATLAGTRALLLSDSSPQGNRAAFARTANRLLAQGVRVYPLQSGWCSPGAPLPMEAMKFFGRMTGGTAFPLTPGTGLTHTLMALNLMAAPDDILALQDRVTPADPNQHTFFVDSSVGSITLQIDDDDDTEEDPEDDDWWLDGCLTCTNPIPAPRCHNYGCTPLTATLQLPGGQIVGHGDPRVTFLHTGYATQMQISSGDQSLLPPGPYTVRIQGNSAYALRALADAGIHMAYLGSHSVPAGDPFAVRVALLLPAVQGRPAAPAAGALAGATLAARFVSLDGGQVITGTLYDDGQHGDGAAGDDIFGGPATLPPGTYHLVVRGELGDGDTIQRVDPAPIRARAFRLPSPGTRSAQAGTTVTHTFVLTNDGDSAQTFDLLAESAQGWAQTNSIPLGLTLAPGETRTFSVPVLVPATATVGAADELTLTAVGPDLLASETATARTLVAGDFDLYLPLLRR